MHWKRSEGIACQWYENMQLELLRCSFIHSFIHRYLTEIIAYAESFRDGQLLLQHDNYQVLV